MNVPTISAVAVGGVTKFYFGKSWTTAAIAGAAAFVAVYFVLSKFKE